MDRPRIQIEIPTWLDDESQLLRRATKRTPRERMDVVNQLAARNYGEGTGGPFAALISNADSGEILAVGVNLVLSSGLSVAHAEIVAISLAQTYLGTWDLAASADLRYEIAVNWRPCAMCFGAVLWSGVRRLVVAGEGPELEHLTGFDEGPVVENWEAECERRNIEVVKDVNRADALAVFRRYGESDSVVYNPGRQA